ncbi:acyltransferase family protein [Streptomyces sp. NPDC002535]
MTQLAPSTLRVGGPDATPPGREPYFDNAKLLAVVLVVCGHFWEPMIAQSGQRHLKAAYLLLYAFHMPAFILISGFFSRGFTAQPRQMRRLTTGMLIPFLLWGTLLTYFNSAFTGAEAKVQPLTPVWITWFLIALFLWRLSAPLWQTLRAPTVVATVIFFAAGAFTLGAQISITRFLQFLPFFVLGLTLRPSHLAWLRDTRWVKAAAVAAFTVAGVGAYWVAPGINPAWLYRSQSADQLHVSYTDWLIHAGAIYIAGLVLTAAFLALVPKRRAWYTALGAGTICAFLLHAFVQRAMFHTDTYDHALLHQVPGQIALTVGSVALALLLCTQPVQRLMRPLVEPRLSWLFRSSDSPVPSRHAAPESRRRATSRRRRNVTVQ